MTISLRSGNRTCHSLYNSYVRDGFPQLLCYNGGFYKRLNSFVILIIAAFILLDPQHYLFSSPRSPSQSVSASSFGFMARRLTELLVRHQSVLFGARSSTGWKSSNKHTVLQQPNTSKKNILRCLKPGRSLCDVSHIFRMSYCVGCCGGSVDV